MTHSLLSSWLYTMKANPFEDSLSWRDSYAEFLATLRKEPTETTDIMQKGIDFENLVTAILNRDEAGKKEHAGWHDAAYEVANIVRGGTLQFKAKKEIEVAGMKFLLYGRLDALKAGVIYDIKFSGNYERGKYLNSTQHPTYFELIPHANDFVYVISNGSAVWTESYRREESADISRIIADFVEYLKVNDNLMDIYKSYWAAL